MGSDRRQAIYTTLPPGTYTFRAQAATSSGPWSEPGVALRVKILEPWWSTSPFRAAVVTLLMLLAWAAYRQRVNQIARQFEARVAERTRIARELHDTLLQTLHGLMFQFQAVRNVLSRRPEEAVHSLDDAINDTERALAESRDAIQNIRSEPPAERPVSQNCSLLLIANWQTLELRASIRRRSNCSKKGRAKPCPKRPGTRLVG